MRKGILFFLLLIVFCFSIFANNPKDVTGDWEGVLNVQGNLLEFMTHFTYENGIYYGTIDIPIQYAYDIEVYEVSYEDSSLYFEMESPIGLAMFDGFVKDGMYAGMFFQNDIEGDFIMGREGFLEEMEKYSSPTKSFVEEEIVVSTDYVDYYGTLSYPDKENKYPLLVFVNGSGSQDRDNNIMGFKSFELLADYLTSSGYAVFRYDDPGTGKTQLTKTVEEYTNFTTTATLAEDVYAMVKKLREHENIGKKAGILGHSEGAIVTTILASKYDDIDFIIALGLSGVDGKEVVLDQLQALAKAEGMSEEQIAAELKLQNDIFNAMGNKEKMAEIRVTLEQKILDEYEKLPESEKVSDAELEAFISNKLAEFDMLELPWMKFFYEHDPSKNLEKIKVPTLVLLGDKDLQVTYKLNKEPIIAALKKAKNKNFKVEVLYDANHLFQEAKTGSVAEYSTLKKEFVPGLEEYIKNWLDENVKEK